jgi:hypothetical protein
VDLAVETLNSLGLQRKSRSHLHRLVLAEGPVLAQNKSKKKSTAKQIRSRAARGRGMSVGDDSWSRRGVSSDVRLSRGRSPGEAVRALELGRIWAGGDAWRRLGEESSWWPVTSGSRERSCGGESRNLAGDILERTRECSTGRSRELSYHTEAEDQEQKYTIGIRQQRISGASSYKPHDADLLMSSPYSPTDSSCALRS